MMQANHIWFYTKLNNCRVCWAIVAGHFVVQ